MQVTIENITKEFGSLKAIDDINLNIADGDFFTLLGPSGCGKTTLLRTIAGFYQPDGGRILFGDQVINNIPAHKRETGMVFQNYALFPHMNVFDNVAYGLRARKTAASEIKRLVPEILESVELGGFGERLPSQLSGGQQQRVALARALVIRPQVLLMDEPLSNLDAKLRVSMREEIRRIQKELGITTIYVTHDQEEAMAVSDKIAVFSKGRIEQTGTPAEIYFKPTSRFVADFMGNSNIIEAKALGYAGGVLEANVGNDKIKIMADHAVEGDIALSLRPEWIRVDGDGSNSFEAEVISSTFLGSMLRYRVSAFGGQELVIEMHDPQRAVLKEAGEKLNFSFMPDRPVILER